MQVFANAHLERKVDGSVSRTLRPEMGVHPMLYNYSHNSLHVANRNFIPLLLTRHTCHSLVFIMTFLLSILITNCMLQLLYLTGADHFG